MTDLKRKIVTKFKPYRLAGDGATYDALADSSRDAFKLEEASELCSFRATRYKRVFDTREEIAKLIEEHGETYATYVIFETIDVETEY